MTNTEIEALAARVEQATGPDEFRIIGGAALEVFGWQPIETAPRDGTKFLAWSKRDGLILMIGHETGSETWSLERRIKKPEPTHWLPLPTQPGAT